MVFYYEGSSRNIKCSASWCSIALPADSRSRKWIWTGGKNKWCCRSMDSWLYKQSSVSYIPNGLFSSNLPLCLYVFILFLMVIYFFLNNSNILPQMGNPEVLPNRRLTPLQQRNFIPLPGIGLIWVLIPYYLMYAVGLEQLDWR